MFVIVRKVWLQHHIYEIKNGADRNQGKQQRQEDPRCLEGLDIREEKAWMHAASEGR